MTLTSTPRRAWLVWGVGLAAYVLAIFHRSSLAVAGLVATERFGLSASGLASFTMLQLLVYAGMQVPVGLMVDRFGPRRVLSVGLVLMALGQGAFAFAESYPAALFARALVGMGDAMTFICVLRLAGSWFAIRQIPLVSQLTGGVGQLGAIASAVPMTWALGRFGWTTAYLTASIASVVLLVAVLVSVRDTPTGTLPRASREGGMIAPLVADIRATWAQPGTRLGFWTHFTAQFSTHVFSLSWGFPFLVRGEGVSETAAGSLLSVLVVAAICAGPVIGWATGYHPFHRSTMVLGAIGALALVWLVVLAWPAEAPLPLLVVLVAVLGIGGPVSMIAFDVGRTSNPGSRYATATGLINQGGFLAAVTAILSIGLVLDWLTPGASTTYSPEAFKWAMSVQFIWFVLGALQIWKWRRRLRRRVPREVVVGGSTAVDL